MSHQSRQLGRHVRRSAVGGFVEDVRPHRRKLPVNCVHEGQNAVDSKRRFPYFFQRFLVFFVPLFVKHKLNGFIGVFGERSMGLQRKVKAILREFNPADVLRLFAKCFHS